MCSHLHYQLAISITYLYNFAPNSSGLRHNLTSAKHRSKDWYRSKPDRVLRLLCLSLSCCLLCHFAFRTFICRAACCFACAALQALALMRSIQLHAERRVMSFFFFFSPSLLLRLLCSAPLHWSSSTTRFLHGLELNLRRTGTNPSSPLPAYLLHYPSSVIIPNHAYESTTRTYLSSFARNSTGTKAYRQLNISS